jgi:hypothetical protein
LISGAFSTMIPMPHTFSPHFTWLVALKGYSCSPKDSNKANSRNLHIMGSIISAEKLLTAPPDWLNQPCRQDARREKLTTYNSEAADFFG